MGTVKIECRCRNEHTWEAELTNQFRIIGGESFEGEGDDIECPYCLCDPLEIRVV